MQAKKQLRKILRGQKISTMPELQRQLEGRSRISVFRDLKELGYCSSYDHAGKFYTLLEIARFSEQGLWRYQGVGFSRHGTLKETVFFLVESSAVGYRHEELSELLHVRVHNTLLALVQEKRLKRISQERQFLYVSANRPQLKRQQQERGARERVSSVPITAELVIEILAEVIRGSRICVELRELTSRLIKRGVRVGERQVAQVLQRYNVKKTLGSK